MMNIGLFGGLSVYIILKLLPLRAIAVLCLWISALRNSEFFSTLGLSTMKRLRKIDYFRMELYLLEKKDKLFEWIKKLVHFAI